jgi:hypothetical protein
MLRQRRKPAALGQNHFVGLLGSAETTECALAAEPTPVERLPVAVRAALSATTLRDGYTALGRMSS